MGKNAWIALGASMVVSGCTAGHGGAGLAMACTDNASCASGMCIDDNQATATRSYCSGPCTSDADCAGTGFSLFHCDTAAGHCVEPCSEGSHLGSGATLELCDHPSGRYVACSSLDAATQCGAADCGCEPFGGGTCVIGTGCVHPMPDGSSCTLDAGCTSGACYRDTHVCGAPRPMGGSCTVDAECASLNCSNDGDVTMVGHCNQELGSTCTAPLTGHNVTATCNDCDIIFGASAGYCLRTHCNLTTHDHCPSFAGHVFACATSTAGGDYCYETCMGFTYHCYYDSQSCFTDSMDYCR